MHNGSTNHNSIMHVTPSYPRSTSVNDDRQVSWLMVIANCTFPYNCTVVDIAAYSHLQWRDRVGIAPTSLLRSRGI
jgi:hypothetical protein